MMGAMSGHLGSGASFQNQRMNKATVQLSDAGSHGRPEVVAHPSGQLLQICHATVRWADGNAGVALFLSAGTEAASLTPDSLATLMVGEPAGTIAVLVRDSSEGRATVELNSEDEPRALPVASAVAVMQASWGWDESPTIVVAVNGVSISVSPRFTGDRWTALDIARHTA